MFRLGLLAAALIAAVSACDPAPLTSTATGLAMVAPRPTETPNVQPADAHTDPPQPTVISRPHPMDAAERCSSRGASRRQSSKSRTARRSTCAPTVRSAPSSTSGSRRSRHTTGRRAQSYWDPRPRELTRSWSAHRFSIGRRTCRRPISTGGSSSTCSAPTAHSCVRHARGLVTPSRARTRRTWCIGVCDGRHSERHGSLSEGREGEDLWMRGGGVWRQVSIAQATLTTARATVRRLRP